MMPILKYSPEKCDKLRSLITIGSCGRPRYSATPPFSPYVSNVSLFSGLAVKPGRRVRTPRRQTALCCFSQDCLFLRMPDHVLRRVFSLLDTRTLAAVKSTCSDFNFIVNHFDIRATDSRWTKDHRSVCGFSLEFPGLQVL